MKNFLLLLLASALLAQDGYFFAKPYLQLGDRPQPAGGALDLQWLGHDKEVDWKVEYQVGSKWTPATARMLRKVDFPGTAAHRVYSASLDKLKAGAEFRYRVMAEGKVVFESTAKARKAAGANTRFVVFGDTGADSPGQREVAFQVGQQKADYVLIPGDIVYSRGRVSEYASNFWPIFNSDKASPVDGAPVLRSTLAAGTVGNHDSQALIALDKNPDPLAYFLYWSQPLNGPPLSLKSPHVPKFEGDEGLAQKFVSGAGTNFPKAVNFSFDYGNVHWTLLDSNSFVDWSDPELQAWLRKDLAAASKAQWRLVAFHHPPYNSSKVSHFREQRMRVISPLLEEYKVDLVLSGHVHNYQRTFPLRFAPQAGFVLGKNQEVPGNFTFDKDYDGVTKTKPQGVIYITTGAGGAGQYEKEFNVGPDYYQEFTTRFVPFPHSFSVIETSAKELVFKQIDATGKERDAFKISR